MQSPRVTTAGSAAVLAFPDLEPAQALRADGAGHPSGLPAAAPRSPSPFAARSPLLAPTAAHPAPPPDQRLGSVRASVLSFGTMHLWGDLLVNFLKARKRTFIDKLHWNLPQTEGMEFDQYDTPLARWIIIHEFGEVLGGIRMTPTTASCGIYSYMLRDAQRGLLHGIPTDVLFFEAPVSPTIWEASRLFIAEDVPSHRRLQVQSILMQTLSAAAQEVGASHVIGIVPAVWSRWLRRLSLDAVPVGPRFSIDGSASQAALFNTARRRR